MDKNKAMNKKQIPKITGFLSCLTLTVAALQFFSIEAVGQSPSPTCGCLDVTVTLNDTTCTFRLESSTIRVNGGNCSDNLTVRIADNNPNNADIIDCPGTYTYGLFLGSSLACWGRVTAEDKSGPKLEAWIGRCNKIENGSEGTVPSSSDPIAPPFLKIDSVRMDTFLCMDIDQIQNVPLSWDLSNPIYPYFAGTPVFVDGCKNRRIIGSSEGSNNTILCDCRTDLRVNDQITYFPCPLPITSSGLKGVWARVSRVFTATDCRGNSTKMTQIITFVRPPIITLSDQIAAAGGSYKTVIGDGTKTGVLLDNNASPRLRLVIDSFKCEPYPNNELVNRLRAWYYIFDDPFKCDDNTHDDYAYFPEGASSAPRRPVLGCNFSFDSQVIANYPACDGFSKKLIVQTNYFDWCSGVSLPLDTIEILDNYPNLRSLKQRATIAGGIITQGESSVSIVGNQIEVVLGPENCDALPIQEILRIFLNKFYDLNDPGGNNNGQNQNLSYYETEQSFGYSKKWIECGNFNFGNIYAEVIRVIPSSGGDKKKIIVKVSQNEICTDKKLVLDEIVTVQ